MQTNTIEPLDWDSKFFGYPIARIAIDQNGIEVLEYLFRQITSENIRLAYLFVPPAEKEINEQIVKNGGILVDQKTVFLKAPEKHTGFINQICEYQGIEINERLIELVLQAGKFSRFHIDKNFSNKEYERLYIEWLTKSVNKTIAFKTLVANKGSGLIGITTLGEKANYMDIGLVAVDEKYRGQGIGYDLIHAADTIAYEMGFKKIKVVTQLQNKGACKLYEKCDFHIESITNIYHYWQ